MRALLTKGGPTGVAERRKSGEELVAALAARFAPGDASLADPDALPWPLRALRMCEHLGAWLDENVDPEGVRALTATHGVEVAYRAIRRADAWLLLLERCYQECGENRGQPAS